LNPAYQLRQAARCLRHSPFAAAVAAGTVAVALGVSGTSLLAVRAVEAVLRSYGADARVTLFLDPALKDPKPLVAQAEQVAGPGSRAEFIAPDVALGRPASPSSRTETFGTRGRQRRRCASSPA